MVPVAMGSMITEGEDAAATSARRESEKTMVMEEEQWLCHCFVEGDFCWKWCLESRHPLSATRPTAPRNKHIPPFQNKLSNAFGKGVCAYYGGRGAA